MRMRINRKDNEPKTHTPSTRQRRLLLDLLRMSTEHLDAKKLYRKAVERDPKISLATVYRNLRLFKELGLIEERHLDEIHCFYEIKGNDEHYHMICSGCGNVAEFHSSHVRELVEEVRDNSNFDVTKAVLYLEGYCSKCQHED